MVTADPFIQYCIDQLRDKFSCHTVILYGSYARGDTTPASDLDLVGFSTVAQEKLRDARMHNGKYLDLFVFPPSIYENPDETHIYMRGGKVLLESSGSGTTFLRKLEEIFQRGPKKLPDDEKQARRVWAHKMLQRAKVNDLEGLYRAAWLKIGLLEDYFALRDQWYQGSKNAFQFLQEKDPETFKAFERVFEKNSTLDDLEKLIGLTNG